MYKITLNCYIQEKTYNEVKIANNKDELFLIYNEMTERWFYKICPNLKLNNKKGVFSYHLILRRINEMNNKDDGDRKFDITVEELNIGFDNLILN